MPKRNPGKWNHGFQDQNLRNPACLMLSHTHFGNVDVDFDLGDVQFPLHHQAKSPALVLQWAPAKGRGLPQVKQQMKLVPPQKSASSLPSGALFCLFFVAKGSPLKSPNPKKMPWKHTGHLSVCESLVMSYSSYRPEVCCFDWLPSSSEDLLRHYGGLPCSVAQGSLESSGLAAKNNAAAEPAASSKVVDWFVP